MTDTPDKRAGEYTATPGAVTAIEIEEFFVERTRLLFSGRQLLVEIIDRHTAAELDHFIDMNKGLNTLNDRLKAEKAELLDILQKFIACESDLETAFNYLYQHTIAREANLLGIQTDYGTSDLKSLFLKARTAIAKHETKQEEESSGTDTNRNS